MHKRVAWAGAAVLALAMPMLDAATAMAADRPLFDFRGEIPVPGGTAQWEARCDAGGDALHCRVEGKGPSQRGFRAEGRILLTPQAPPAPEPPGSGSPRPQWF